MTTENITNVPRMRTIDNAYAEIKALDPQTDFTKRALRRMVKTKEIPTQKIGNKNLINLDLLIAKLSGSCYNDNAICVS
ncbi:MAG: hypothetical protein UFA98_01825 [Ruminococcus sp.]|nr:hypothetical protein [Ruminococcus sp.]